MPEIAMDKDELDRLIIILTDMVVAYDEVMSILAIWRDEHDLVDDAYTSLFYADIPKSINKLRSLRRDIVED